MAHSPIVGDLPAVATKNIATALPFPQVAAANIADVDHQINASLKSGKKLGASVIDEAGILYIALGTASTSGWVKQSDGSTVTPT